MLKSEPKIAAIVVTYNRSDLLKKCLSALEVQTLRPTMIYIVDNASTDNTEKTVNTINHKIQYEYIQLSENIGGAGGFYTGLKTAYEKGKYDAFWLMDDDGIPDKECLKILYDHISNNFVAPLVLDIDNKESVAFPYLKKKSYHEILDKYGNIGTIYNYANPFNGILLSTEMISKVGYPMKEMFIWGDEDEYQLRASSKGYVPHTIINAIHYHPKDRLVLHKDFLGKSTIIYVDSTLRRYCKYRNTAYSLMKYGKITSILKYLISYPIYYLFFRKFDIKGLKLFILASIHGFKSDFKHTKEYMNH